MKSFKILELNDSEHEAIGKVRDQPSVSSTLFVRIVVLMAIDELAVKTAKDYANEIFNKKIDELKPDNYG